MVAAGEMIRMLLASGVLRDVHVGSIYWSLVTGRPSVIAETEAGRTLLGCFGQQIDFGVG